MVGWGCKGAVSSYFSLAERLIISFVAAWLLTNKWYSVGHECETVMKEFDVLLPLFMFPLLFRNKSIPVKNIWGNFSYLDSLRYLFLLPWGFLNTQLLFVNVSTTYSLSELFFMMGLFSSWVGIVVHLRVLSEGFT